MGGCVDITARVKRERTRKGMGKYFSDVVEGAIEDLYYCYDNDRAKAAADALLFAAKEGDGDACYFLSRCFSGVCYSWHYHPFQEN